MPDLFDQHNTPEAEPHWLDPIDLPEGVMCGSLLKARGMRFLTNNVLIGIANSKVFYYDEPQIARRILLKRGVKIF